MSKFDKDFDNIKCESLLKRLPPNLQCWPQWGRSTSKPTWIRKRRNTPLFPSPVQKPLRLTPENWSQQMDVAKRICWGLLPQRIERNVGAAHRDMTAELCKLSVWQLLNSRCKSRTCDYYVINIVFFQFSREWFATPDFKSQPEVAVPARRPRRDGGMIVLRGNNCIYRHVRSLHHSGDSECWRQTAEGGSCSSNRLLPQANYSRNCMKLLHAVRFNVLYKQLIVQILPTRICAGEAFKDIKLVDLLDILKAIDYSWTDSSLTENNENTYFFYSYKTIGDFRIFDLTNNSYLRNIHT